MPAGAVVLSRAAIADLDAIADHIAERNPTAAQRIIAELNGVFELLALFPQMGRLHDELTGAPRVFPVRSYLIVYDAIGRTGIEILRVYHTTRDRDEL